MSAQKQQGNSEPKKVIGRPFPKGVSGNPGGRPKGVSITAKLRMILSDDDEATDLARKIIDLAKDGNAAAIKAVLERVDGPVPVDLRIKEELDLSGATVEELAQLEDILESARSGESAD